MSLLVNHPGISLNYTKNKHYFPELEVTHLKTSKFSELSEVEKQSLKERQVQVTSEAESFVIVEEGLTLIDSHQRRPSSLVRLPDLYATSLKCRPEASFVPYLQFMPFLKEIEFQSHGQLSNFEGLQSHLSRSSITKIIISCVKGYNDHLINRENLLDDLKHIAENLARNNEQCLQIYVDKGLYFDSATVISRNSYDSSVARIC